VVTGLTEDYLNRSWFENYKKIMIYLKPLVPSEVLASSSFKKSAISLRMQSLCAPPPVHFPATAIRRCRTPTLAVRSLRAENEPSIQSALVSASHRLRETNRTGKQFLSFSTQKSSFFNFYKIIPANSPGNR